MAGKNEFISGSKKALYTIIRPSILVAETLSLFHFHTSFCATWVFDLENSCSFNERVGRPPLVLPGPSSTQMTDAVKNLLAALVCLFGKSQISSSDSNASILFQILYWGPRLTRILCPGQFA